jgi:hypothetical protein
MTRRAPHTQAEVERYVRGVVKAGVKVASVRIDSDSIVILAADEAAPEAAAGGAIAAWRAKKNARKA